MPIALTDDHRELGAVARSFLNGQKARSAARAALDAGEESRPPFWREMAALGWLGLHVDEAYGGSGFGLPELVVVIEELGHAVARAVRAHDGGLRGAVGGGHRGTEGPAASRPDRRNTQRRSRFRR